MKEVEFPKLSDMMESVERSRTYQDYADSLEEYGYSIIENRHLVFLKLLQGILYREYRLSANAQRDLAHKLGHILEHVISYREDK